MTDGISNTKYKKTQTPQDLFKSLYNIVILPRKNISFSAFEKIGTILLEAHIFKHIYIQAHTCMHKNIHRYAEEERVL